jgi:hypothetical protein
MGVPAGDIRCRDEATHAGHGKADGDNDNQADALLKRTELHPSTSLTGHPLTNRCCHSSVIDVFDCVCGLASVAYALLSSVCPTAACGRGRVGRLAADHQALQQIQNVVLEGEDGRGRAPVRRRPVLRGFWPIRRRPSRLRVRPRRPFRSLLTELADRNRV